MRGRARAHAAALGNPTSRAVSVAALAGEADIRKGVLYEQSLEPHLDARSTHAARRRHRRPWLRDHHGKLGLYRPQNGCAPLADHFRCRHFAVLPEAHGQRQPQRGQRHPHHHVRGRHGRRRPGVYHPGRLDAGLCRPDQLARHVYRGARRHHLGPSGDSAHPPSLYRGRRAGVPHRQRRSSDPTRDRGRRQDRQAALWLHGHRRHLQRAARRPGRGAQHAVHAQHPRRDLCHLQLAHVAVHRLFGGLRPRRVLVCRRAAGQFWHHRRRHRCRPVRCCDRAGYRQVPRYGPYDGLWRRRRP